MAAVVFHEELQRKAEEEFVGSPSQAQDGGVKSFAQPNAPRVG
jgi:hypothetical protein